MARFKYMHCIVYTLNTHTYIRIAMRLSLDYLNGTPVFNNTCIGGGYNRYCSLHHFSDWLVIWLEQAKINKIQFNSSTDSFNYERERERDIGSIRL